MVPLYISAKLHPPALRILLRHRRSNGSSSSGSIYSQSPHLIDVLSPVLHYGGKLVPKVVFQLSSSQPWLPLLLLLLPLLLLLLLLLLQNELPS
jgi:hypothetical protein